MISKMLNLKAVLVYTTMIVLGACTSGAGEGGTALISGKVVLMQTDRLGNDKGVEEARDEKVFLVYGDDAVFSEDVRTHSDGTYEFKYLRKGNYTIFAYQNCDSCGSGNNAVEVQVEITENRSVVEASNISLIKVLDPDDGSSSIQGKLFQQEKNTGGQLLSEYYLGDTRVYIQYENEVASFADFRTHSDGSFIFRDLIPGSYTIFAFSDCSTCSSGTEAIELQASITQSSQAVTLDDLVIVKIN